MGEFDEKAKRSLLDWQAKSVDATPVVGKTTGVGIVDDGTVCDRDPTRPGCWLTADQRTRLLSVLGDAAGVAFGNLRDAIQNCRVDLLTVTATSSGWGFLSELLFQSLSGGMIGRLKSSLGKLLATADGAAERVVLGNLSVPASVVGAAQKLGESNIIGAATNASKGLRTALKNASHESIAPDQNVAAGDFLKVIQANVAPMQLAMPKAAIGLSDLEIAELIAALEDQAAYGIPAIEAELRDLCIRFREQELHTIGTTSARTGTSVRDPKGPQSRMAAHAVAPDGRARVVIVQWMNKEWDGDFVIHGGQTVDADQLTLVSMPDDDLVGAALAYQSATGAPMPVLHTKNILMTEKVKRTEQGQRYQAWLEGDEL